MEVILLEKIRNLGNIGDKVIVKNGYARNFLIPESKAIAATAANLDKFNKLRAELEKAATETLMQAQARAEKLTDLTITIPAKATEEGKLFGSIGTSVIAHALQEAGHDVKKAEINLPQGPLRQIGDYDISLLLHTDVSVVVKVKVIPTE